MAKLSLSMIVKNEEKFLKDCLESVKNVVDEIVIVDTGSTDKTIKIAELHGAKIYHFKWVNDFSAARNYSLSKCTGDWILYLDADERLDKKSIPELKKIVSENKKLGVFCTIYNIDDINKKPKLQKYTRLFKNTKGIKFRGRAHEQIVDSLAEKGYSSFQSNIGITHLGYNLSKEDLRKKAERNLSLLVEDYNKKKDSYTAFQLGNTYSTIGDPEKASQYYSEAMKDVKLDKDFFCISASYNAEYFFKLNRKEEALSLINEGLNRNPKHPLLNFVASDLLYKLGDGKTAVELAKIAYTSNEELLSGKTSGLFDVVQDRERIIYHGLFISFKSNIPDGIGYFLDELGTTFQNKEYTFEEESSFIVSLANSNLLEKGVITSYINMLNQNNLEFYLELVGNYEDVTMKVELLEKIREKFNDDIHIWHKLVTFIVKTI